jgi:hypothetical protein
MIEESDFDSQACSGASSTFYAMATVPPGIKRRVQEADYSLPSNAEVKNGGAVPSSSIRLHDSTGATLPSHFYFLFYAITI